MATSAALEQYFMEFPLIRTRGSSRRNISLMQVNRIKWRRGDFPTSRKQAMLASALSHRPSPPHAAGTRPDAVN
jgi:hypothetical protein